MQKFTYCNPVKIVFGKGTIESLRDLLPDSCRVQLLYGGGSIKRNGVYEQVISGLSGHGWAEFSGIEPNPHYETCMKAVEHIKAENLNFILAVGGGSVLDAAKFIAGAVKHTETPDPWDMMGKRGVPRPALSLGAILTLPATGSEMNGNSVITRAEWKIKLPVTSPTFYPQFSILDPETTYTLPDRQTANGIVDAFVHVMEQYLTPHTNAPLQNLQSEAVLRVLIDEGPKAMNESRDYDVRANIMWAATNALNGQIGLGIQQCWATHMIGHELTALYNIDHARTLAVVMPSLFRFLKEERNEKLQAYGRAIWDTDDPEAAIQKTEQFFESLGVPTRLSAYEGTREAPEIISKRFTEYGYKLGAKQNIGPEEIRSILTMAMG